MLSFTECRDALSCLYYQTISFILHTHSCVWKYSPLAILSFVFLLFSPTFVMLSISCRWSHVICHNCMPPPLPLCVFACTLSCRCWTVQTCQFLQLLPCRHTALLFLAHLLSSGVLFIPEDKMKSSHDTYNAATMLFHKRKKINKSVFQNGLLQYSEVAVPMLFSSLLL